MRIYCRVTNPGGDDPDPTLEREKRNWIRFQGKQNWTRPLKKSDPDPDSDPKTRVDRKRFQFP